MTRAAITWLLLAVATAAAGCSTWGPPTGDKFRALFWPPSAKTEAARLRAIHPADRRWAIVAVTRRANPWTTVALQPTDPMAAAVAREEGEGGGATTTTVMAVIRLMVNKDYETEAIVRAAAAVACRELTDRKALPQLAAGCADADELVRRECARSLGELGTAAQAPVLAQLLQKDRDPDVRATAADALAAIGSPAALPALAAGLSDYSPSVRFAAHEGLIKLTGVDQGTDAARWRAWLKERAAASVTHPR